MLLFTGNSVAFYGTIFFRLKTLMLALAHIMEWYSIGQMGRKIAEWNENLDTPGVPKPPR